MKNLIFFICIIVFFIFFSNFSFSQIEPPSTLEEGTNFLIRIWNEMRKNFFSILNENVLPVWKKLWNWFKENILVKIENLFKIEMEKRKSIIKEELEKEKEETKKDLPNLLKFFLNKLREIIK